MRNTTLMLRQLSDESGPECEWREETGPGTGLMFNGGNPDIKTFVYKRVSVLRP